MRFSLALWIACALSSPAAAQDVGATLAVPSAAEESTSAAEAGPLVIHLDEEFSSFGASLVRTLARRIEIEVELGAAPPGGNALALPVGHVGIVATEAHDRTMATVVWLGDHGRVFETEVALPRQRAAALRALSLAVIDLRDAVLEAPPLEDEPIFAGESPRPARGGSSYVYLEREGGLFGRRRTIEALARPTIYFRALLGFSSAREAFLVGPGVGVGLCVGDHCVVIEGDLPVLEQQHIDEEDGSIISYRAVNLALRLQLRPIRIDDVTVGATLGLLSRVGSAWTADGTTRLVSSFGIRSSLEVAWQFERPFEWVIEAGADVPLNPATFIQSERTSTRLEADVTVWGVTALRVRP